MRLLKTKTTRFSDVLTAAGPVEVYTLWQKPAADRRLQSLIKNNRIMTVLKSENGTEFGQAGFKEQKGAHYLAFAKSLKRYANHRIVGIKWDMIGS